MYTSRWRRKLYRGSKVAVVAIYTLVCVFPVLWMVSMAFKSVVDTTAYPPVLLFQPTLDNFREVFVARSYGPYFVNSFVIAPVVTVLTVLLGSMAAYGLARMKVGGKVLPFWVLATRMFPPMVVALPVFILFARVNLLDSRLGLILIYTTFFLPFVIWLMRSYFMEIPLELEEAAMVDGQSRWGAMVDIILPLTLPGLAVTGLFVFMNVWNEFLFAVILTSLNKTAPVAAVQFQTEYEIIWGAMAAAGTVIILPMLALSMLVQKHIVRGLTLGAVKG